MVLSGPKSKILNYKVFLSLKIVFILANSADPDEMTPFTAFHLVLTVCQSSCFTGIQNGKG